MYPQSILSAQIRKLSFFHLKISFLQPLKIAAYCLGKFAYCRLDLYTMRHKFSNFHSIFKMQIGMKIKRKKIFDPSIFDTSAIIMSYFHCNTTFL